MDLLQKEHERAWKRMKAAKSINDVQATIDLLQKARDSIAAGRPSTFYQYFLVFLVDGSSDFSILYRSDQSFNHTRKATESGKGVIRCDQRQSEGDTQQSKQVHESTRQGKRKC